MRDRPAGSQQTQTRGFRRKGGWKIAVCVAGIFDILFFFIPSAKFLAPYLPLRSKAAFLE